MDKNELKGRLRRSALGGLLLAAKEGCENWVRRRQRQPYIAELQHLINPGGGGKSVITTNCFAGRIMQDLGMEYNSPTLGLYFMYPDYIEFLQHLEFYLKEAPLTFAPCSKFPLCNQRRKERAKTHHWYPIGLLDGKVEIHFLHYHSEEEAAVKWRRRAARVNWDNLLVIGMEQNQCTEADIRAFDALPYEHKLFFSTRELPALKSNVYMPEFAGHGEVGDPYKKGHIFYRYLVERLKNLPLKQ